MALGMEGMMALAQMETQVHGTMEMGTQVNGIMQMGSNGNCPHSKLRSSSDAKHTLYLHWIYCLDCLSIAKAAASICEFTRSPVRRSR
jgi:hypothetical protein